LSSECPPRVIVSVTLPEQPCAAVTPAGSASLPVIVRRTWLCLSDLLAIFRLRSGVNFATVTLRDASATEPSASVTTARSAWPPTSAPVALIVQV
jgi:hypothetical protein